MQKICKNILMMLFVVFVISACTAAKIATPEPITTVYLNDLEPISVSVGFEGLGRGVNPFTEEELIKGQTIKAHNEIYSQGLFAHAPAHIEYKIDGAYSNISGYVLMHDGLNCGDGARFILQADGHDIYTSPILTSSSTPVAFQSDVTGVQTLVLKVDSLNNMECDWSIWGDPLLTKGNRPITETVVESISTPTSVPTKTIVPTIPPTSMPADHPGWMPAGAIARFGKGKYSRMAVSPDNSLVAIAASGGVYFSDPLSGQVTDFIETGWIPKDVLFSSDGRKLYIGMGGAGVYVWNRTASGSWEKSDPVIPICADRILISPDDELLLAKCFSENKRLVVWDMSTQQKLYENNYNMEKDIAFAMAFSPTNPNLVAIAANYTVTLMDAQSGKVQGTYYEPDKNIITDLDFSPDGSTLALAPYSPSVILLNAESFQEIKRIVHQSDVYQLSFMDNDTLVSFNQNSYVVQKTDGGIVKTIERGAEPIHVFVPKYNVMYAGDYFNVDIISLDSYQVVKKIEGFHPSYWMNMEITGNGNGFKGGTWAGRDNIYFTVSYSDNPDHLEDVNASSVCDGVTWSRFVDNAGKYIGINCESSKKLLVVELATKNIVSSYPMSLHFVTNADLNFHPWSDERELIAILYETPASSTNAYRIEIWEPLLKKKISGFDVDGSESNTSKPAAPWLIKFSNHSTYLVVAPGDRKNLIVYNVETGLPVLVIPNNLYPQSENGPSPFELTFNDAETMLFVRNKGNVEIYSMESGELIRKFANLRGENMAYFDENMVFTNYYITQPSQKGKVVYFDRYDLISGEKIRTDSVELPFNAQETVEEAGVKYVGAIKYLYFHPENQGNTAAVYMYSYPLQQEYYENMIYVIDIPGGIILKTYTWNYGGPYTNTFASGNVLFTEQEDIIFEWDISVGE